MQGWAEGLLTNVVLWSIHYEIIFYLLFLVAGKTKKAILVQGLVCLALGMAMWLRVFIFMKFYWMKNCGWRANW